MGLEHVLDIARADPARCALFTDMDGTIADIVDDPDSVTPIAGTAELLNELAMAYGAVAVVSGRSVSFLDRFFAPPVELSGLYGIEHRTTERLLIDSDALEWLPTIDQTANDARTRFGIDAVEDKRYSLTVHYRTADASTSESILDWAGAVGTSSGLLVRAAKMSVELHPPIKRTKGDVVGELVSGMRAGVYLGDDCGDLPAFEQLHFLKTQGQLEAIATVVVDGDETPAELRELATDQVSSPAEAIDLLSRFRSEA